MSQITTFLKTYLLYCIVAILSILGYSVIEFVDKAKLEEWVGHDSMYLFGLFDYEFEDNDKDIIELFWFSFILGIACLMVDYLYQLYSKRSFLNRFMNASFTVFIVIVSCSFIFELLGSCDHYSFFFDASTSKCQRNKDMFINRGFFVYSNMTLIADFIGLAIGIGVMIFFENFPFYQKIGNFIKKVISFVSSRVSRI